MRKPASVPGWGATITARPEHVPRAGRRVCFGVALALTAAVLLATAAAVTAAPVIIGDRITVGNGPIGVAVNETTNRVYVANSSSDSVSRIDGATGAVISTTVLPPGSAPVGVAVNETTNRVYVANVSSGSVSVIGGVSGMVVGSIQLPAGSGPRAVAVNETTSRVYVANASSNSVSVIDGATGTVIGSPIPVGSAPGSVAVNETTNLVYVANGWGDSVSVIDGATRKVISTIVLPADSDPTGVAVNESTNRVYVSNGRGDSVSVISGVSGMLVGSIPVGDAPNGVAVNETTNRVYVTNNSSHSVSVINGATLTVIGSVTAQNVMYPRGVAVNEITNRTYFTHGYNFVSVIQDAALKTSLTFTAPNTCPYRSAKLYGYLEYAKTGGTLAPVSGETVSVQQYVSGRWVTIATPTTSSTGRWDYTATPTKKATYRAVYAGSPTYTRQTSATKSVLPAASLTAPTVEATQIFGTTYTASGYLKPKHTAGTYPVKVLAYHYEQRADGTYGYVYKESFAAKASDNADHTKYSASIKLPYAGTWRLRTFHPEDDENATTYSDYAYVTVKRTTLTIYGPEVSAYGSAKLHGYLKYALPTGSLQALKGATVSVQHYTDGAWRTITKVTTNDSGRWAYTVKPTVRTSYRVTYAGDATYLKRTSAKLSVKPKLLFSDSPRMTTYTHTLGKTHSAWGYIKPKHSTGSTQIKVYAYRYEKKADGTYGYVYKKSYSTTISNPSGSAYSKYKGSVKLPSKGKWRLRAFHAEDSKNAKSYSSYRYVTVK